MELKFLRVSVAFLLVTLAGLGWEVYAGSQTSARRDDEIKELTTKLAEKSAADTLALQAKCAAQAEQVFIRLGYKPDGSISDGISAIYQNHYNPSFQKCFMTLETTSLSSGTTLGMQERLLFDAYEQREYAEYTWIPQKDKKYWEVPPMICKLTPSTGNDITCESDAAYKAFVAQYME